MREVLFVVIGSKQAEYLNRSDALSEGSRVMQYGEAPCGSRFDAIVVMNSPMSEKEREWLKDVQCRLKPGGELIGWPSQL